MSRSAQLPWLVCVTTLAGPLAGCFEGTDNGPPSVGSTSSTGTSDSTSTGAPQTGAESGSTTADEFPSSSSSGDATTSDDTGAPETGSVAGGSLLPLPAFPDSLATGFAVIVRRADRTELSLQVSGLAPNTFYEALVHTTPCADDGGGPPYLVDPDAAADADNLLLFELAAEGSGYTQATLSTEHVATADARSLVVYDVAMRPDPAPRLLCADLVTTGPSDPFVTNGEGLVLMAAIDAGLDALSTSATMERAVAEGTTVSLDASGLAPETTYAVHVHDRDCSSFDGGGHYKIDDTIGVTDESNELWLPLSTDADGSGQSSIVSEHLARAGAQSIVVHGGEAGGPRLTCIDLDVG